LECRLVISKQRRAKPQRVVVQASTQRREDVGRNNQTLKVFISAELSHLSADENNIRTYALMDAINKPSKMVLGNYLGSHEYSFMVPINTVAEVDELADIAFRKFNQESILLVNGDGSGTLLYSNGTKVQLEGTFKKISAELAATKDSWTRTLDGQHYYTFI
jgi:hypothetical protein